MQETASKLTVVSRRLTAQRGLAGFTIEQLCEEVDVSRRTFFNYFSSKEDAVLGANPDEESRRFADDFLARGSSGWMGVVDDLVELVSSHFESVDIDTAGHSDFMRAIEREPRLLARFIGNSREKERQAVALIVEREGVAAEDPRAEAAVNILSALLRSAGEQLLDPANTRDFPTILTELLAAFRDVLTPDTSRKATP